MMPAELTQPITPLGGFPILATTADILQKNISIMLSNNQQVAIFFANTNLIVKGRDLLPQLHQTNTILINDGIGLDIASKIIHRKKFPENLNGTDFIPPLLSKLKDKHTVFLLGAKPGVAIKAAQHLAEQLGVIVAGTADGYAEAKNLQELTQRINNSGATILLVAMGNPYQERWILENRDQLNVKLLIGVGALLDFLAGDKPRAPVIIRRLRLEWLFRLSLEPSRLLRRYTVDIIVFLIICLRMGKQTPLFETTQTTKDH